MSTTHQLNHAASGTAPVKSPEKAQSLNPHARAVRSCGIWYFIVTIFCGGLGVAACFAEDFVLAAVFVGLAALHFVTGWGLTKLKSWARIPTAVFSGIGLFGFPVGTIIHGYILYTVFSASGQAVFNGESGPAEVRRPSRLFWTGVTILVLLVGSLFLHGVITR